MMVAEDNELAERQRAEQLISEVPKFGDVESVSVHFDEDHSGDPAMWLIFTIPAGIDVNREWLKRFHQYSGEVQTRILHSGLARFPYTRLERAS